MPELWKLLDWIDRLEKIFERKKSTIKQTEIMNVSKATLTGIKNQVRDVIDLLKNNFVPTDSEKLYEACDRACQIFIMLEGAETDAGIAEEIAGANRMNAENREKTLAFLKARYSEKDFSKFTLTDSGTHESTTSDFRDAPDFRKPPEVFKGGDAKQLAAHLAKQK